MICPSFPKAVLASVGILAAAAVSRAAFVDVTASAGIDYVQRVFPNYTNRGQLPSQQHFFSGGAAAGDYDNDGWTDLYVTRSDGSDILYRNLGNGKFADVTNAAFGSNHLANVFTNGAALADIDNDGDLDLYVTTIEHPRHYLYINDGSGKFSESAVARGAHVPEVGVGIRYGYSAAFGDYDRDGYLDLHVTEWRQEGEAVPSQYGVDHPGVRHNTRLLRNRGASQPGYFVDVTDAAGVATEGIPSTVPDLMNSEGFSPRFSDLDGDGWPDLVLAQDHKTSRIFWNDKDGTFTDGTVAAGVGFERYGMGSAVGDYDNDGDLDWFVTSIYVEEEFNSTSVTRRDGNRLYRNDGNRKFTDVTIPAGVLKGGWGWGTAFFDYDNDGDLDIIMTNGMDVILRSEVLDDLFEADQSILWRNRGDGTFENVSNAMGITDKKDGKGLLTFDYDKDGDLDVFIVNTGDKPILYRNDGGNAQKWLRLSLEGRFGSNRQAVGAFVTITPNRDEPEKIMVREVDTGSHFLGQSETALHFGVGGAATSIDEVRIRWPDGMESVYRDFAVNQLYEITQAVEFTTEFEPVELELGDEFQSEVQSSSVGGSIEVAGLPPGLSFDPETGLISGTASRYGVYVADIVLESDGQTVEETMQFSLLLSYEDWALEAFGAEDAADPDVSGESADPDGDGRTNLREYVELTDPTVWDEGAALAIVSVDGEEYLGMSYNVPLHSDRYHMRVEGSADLDTWSSSEGAVVPVGAEPNGKGTVNATVRRPTPIDQDGAGFLRTDYFEETD